MRNEYQQAKASKAGKIMTKQINVMTRIGKEFTNYEWTVRCAEVLEKYNGAKTTRIAMQQMRLAAFNLLGFAE